jgi:hypothetical protein
MKKHLISNCKHLLPAFSRKVQSNVGHRAAMYTRRNEQIFHERSRLDQGSVSNIRESFQEAPEGVSSAQELEHEELRSQAMSEIYQTVAFNSQDAVVSRMIQKATVLISNDPRDYETYCMSKKRNWEITKSKKKAK